MSNVQLPPDSTGKYIDTAAMTDGAVTVQRQKMVLAGGSGTAEVVVVVNAAPGVNDMGLVVRQAGTVDVAMAGKLSLSGTAVVAGTVSLGAGAANIGIINNISATVSVAGNVGLVAGATLNNISATVSVAGNVGITGTATVAGSVGITGTAVAAIRSMYVNAAAPGASRGPRSLAVSTSANATLISAPGAGMAIFVTQVGCSNASGSNARARIGTSASIAQVTMMMAQSGGGFVMQFTPPWMLSANEALLGSVKPNVSEGLFNVHFFVASADAL